MSVSRLRAEKADRDYFCVRNPVGKPQKYFSAERWQQPSKFFCRPIFLSKGHDGGRSHCLLNTHGGLFAQHDMIQHINSDQFTGFG